MLGLLLLHAVALGTPLRNQHVLADVMDAPDVKSRLSRRL